MATHSDQALALLGDPSSEERHVLGAMRYQPNRATLHTDTTLLPANRRAWASWNYVRPDGPARGATLTYYLNRLQGFEADRPVLVTLNRDEAIDPAKVVARFDYAHPIVDEAAVAAQAHQLPLSAGAVSYCGAYWGYGFHEDGVRSALAVCRALRGAPVSAGSPAALRSALYEGTVTHRRAEPAHRFTNRVALPLLFLDEMAELRAVHPLVDLDPSPTAGGGPPPCGSTAATTSPRTRPRCRSAVEEAVARAGGSVRGPVAMLGHLRTWGWLFNPLTLYYCFDPSGRHVEWTVLEVSNTPWHERCRYVVGPPGEHRFAKAMHVSPFLSSAGHLHLALLPAGRGAPGQPRRRGAAPGRAVSSVGRTETPTDPYRSSRPQWCCGAGSSTAPRSARLLWSYPLMTARVSGGIYMQALRLGARRAPFHPHPGRDGQVRACPATPTVPAAALESVHD